MADQLSQDDASSDLGAFDDLLIVRSRRRAEPDTGMDITPMIDITFLLLIFFLVAQQLTQQSPVELPPAQYGDAVPTPLSVIITVADAGDGEAAIYKGDVISADVRLSADDPAVQEQEIAKYVEQELAASPVKQYVLVKAAKGVKHKHIDRISHAVGRVEGVNRLFVAVLETE